MQVELTDREFATGQDSEPGRAAFSTEAGAAGRIQGQEDAWTNDYEDVIDGLTIRQAMALIRLLSRVGPQGRDRHRLRKALEGFVQNSIDDDDEVEETHAG